MKYFTSNIYFFVIVIVLYQFSGNFYDKYDNLSASLSELKIFNRWNEFKNIQHNWQVKEEGGVARWNQELKPASDSNWLRWSRPPGWSSSPSLTEVLRELVVTEKMLGRVVTAREEGIDAIFNVCNCDYILLDFLSLFY